MTAIDKRAAGVLMHISSLPGDYSVGSFGKAAFDFIDFLRSAGFTYWQVLPFGIPDDYLSPYKSVSAFAGNPYFIDLELLHKEGLLTEQELCDARQKNTYLVEAKRLQNERASLLRRAAGRAQNRVEILEFIEENPHLRDACRFLALKCANHQLSWQDWEVGEPCEEDFFYYAFTQFHFHRQWQAVKSYANEKGIKLIGDMPIYVDTDSADVYFNRAEFKLDKKGRPTHVAGVPPDYFSADGQMWGNPLYDWAAMKKNGFAWWRARMAHMLTLFDGVRIDHFRGIESFWSIPADAESAKEGKFCRGPGMAFVKAMQEVAGDHLIIAEDLGDIPPAVVQLLRKSGFPGMRVLQFAFLGDPDSPHLPHTYCHNAVAYTGTHDNNTLLGFLFEQAPCQRKQTLDYCGCHTDRLEDAVDDVIRTMLQSHAGLVMLPMQDLLGFGADTRINTPGRATGNWCYRTTAEQIASIDPEKWLTLNRLYSRI